MLKTHLSVGLLKFSNKQTKMIVYIINLKIDKQNVAMLQILGSQT